MQEARNAIIALVAQREFEELLHVAADQDWKPEVILVTHATGETLTSSLLEISGFEDAAKLLIEGRGWSLLFERMKNGVLGTFLGFPRDELPILEKTDVAAEHPAAVLLLAYAWDLFGVEVGAVVPNGAALWTACRATYDGRLCADERRRLAGNVALLVHPIDAKEPPEDDVAGELMRAERAMARANDWTRAIDIGENATAQVDMSVVHAWDPVSRQGVMPVRSDGHRRTMMVDFDAMDMMRGDPRAMPAPEPDLAPTAELDLEHDDDIESANWLVWVIAVCTLVVFGAAGYLFL